MKIVMFYHSLVSDWNHGNAHFLRGIASELLARGHDVQVFEPSDSWSRRCLVQDFGDEPIEEFHERYPELESNVYESGKFDPEGVLSDADLVIVHEWSDAALVAAIGRLRRRHPFVLLFHDTHHRMVSAPSDMDAYNLSYYDGVLAYGEVLRELYLVRKLVANAWTWHEAADARRFHPISAASKEGDLVWIGNWGDDERTAELHQYLIQPVKALGLKAVVYGVRYPDEARRALKEAGIDYRGWLPNFQVPEVFARFRIAVHVPRRPYVDALPGIPTIRPFEALACGIPLVTSPWEDTERLFTPGRDFLMAHSGFEMREKIEAILNSPTLANELARYGLQTIRKRHTCAHRVDELLEIHRALKTQQIQPKSVAQV